MKNKNKTLIPNIIAIALPIILTLSTLYLIILLSRYSAVSAKLVILVAIALVSIVLLIDLLCTYGFYTKKNIFKYIAIGLSLIFIILTGYGNYYIQSLNNGIDSIIVDENEKETATVAFVVYDNTNIKSTDDIKSSTIFGYIDNTAFQEGNVLALEEIDNLSLDVVLKGYDNYSDLLLALFNNEVDVAALPDNYYEMFVVNDGYEEYLDKTTIIHSYSKEVSTDGVAAVTKDITTEPFTVLIMGIDEARTDTLILATFNPQSMTITMTSIARDSYVPIACYTNNQSDKITHARTVSRSCTIETVQNLLGVDVDFFIEVNFQGVVDIVDALGGLWLTSPVEFVGQDSSLERGTYTIWVNEGYQLMDGQQVLAFARERHHMPNGDFSRQENQQQIIETLATTLLGMSDANKALQVIQAAGTNISTNFSLSQMTQLLNYGIDTLSNTYVGERNGSSVFNIITTRLTGYASWTYNDGLELPLWIYKLYNGSVADNVAIIKRNLQLDTTLKNYFSADFDVSSPYYAPTSYVADTYAEAEVHEKLPDFMKNMVSGNWTLEDLYSWKSDSSYARSGVTIVAHEVTATNEYSSMYSDSYSYHQIIKQSVSYGVKISNISTLEVWYIVKPVDCTIEDVRNNSTYADQCGTNKIVPNFVGMSLSDLNSWKSNHTNVTVNVTTLGKDDAGYNASYAGKVSAQSVSQYTKFVDINYTLNVTYCDYSRVTLDVTTLKAYTTRAQVEAWFTTNWDATPTYTERYSASVNSGMVISISDSTQEYTTNTTLRDNTALTVVISKGNTLPTALPDFVTSGLTYSDYVAYMNSVEVAPKDVSSFTIVPNGGDATLSGKIATQSVVAGSTDYSSVKDLTLTIYE